MSNQTKLEVNFYQEAQDAIEAEYLQSYPLYDPASQQYDHLTKDLDKLKDGFIERQIHGGMHVGRASLWVIVLHQLFKENLPGSVQKSLKSLNQKFKLDEKDIIDFTRRATIYHDSARLNEEKDQWDQQSAEKLKRHVLTKIQNENIAEFFSQATSKKDASDEFINYLDENGIDQCAQYIRILINFSDCIDIIRCCGVFDFDRMLTQLEYLAEFRQNREKIRQVLMEFVGNVHSVIYLQGDMLFDCQIRLEDGSNLKTRYQGDHFNLVRKVQFEHAENCVSALAQNMMHSSEYFVRFFKEEPLLSRKLATVEPLFDAFIHGTQSSMLVMLEKSDYMLDSPLGLLSKQCTSLTGELYGKCGTTQITESPMMCFGKLHSWSGYGLSDVTQNYAKLEAVSLSPDQHQKAAIENFHKFLQYARGNGYKSINALMIYYLRAKYLGVNEDQLMDPQTFYNEYKTTIDMYYLLLIMAEHLELDPDNSLRNPISAELIKSTYQFSNIFERIVYHKLDLKSIYHHPTPENLATLLPLFPSSDAIENSASYVRVLSRSRDCSQVTPDKKFEYEVILCGEFVLKIFNFLNDWDCLASCVQPALQHIHLMEKHLDILKGVIECKPDNVFNHPLHRDLITRNFPLVFITEKSEDLRIVVSRSNKEYRAKRPLKFGEDVKMVATDTREHAVILKKWLDQHGFCRVLVVLFNELEKVKDTCGRPNPLYQHHNGFTSLSWFASQRVNANDQARLIRLKENAEARFNEAHENFRHAQGEELKALFTVRRAQILTLGNLTAQVAMVEDAKSYATKDCK